MKQIVELERALSAATHRAENAEAAYQACRGISSGLAEESDALKARAEAAEATAAELENKCAALAIEAVHLRARVSELESVLKTAQSYLGVLEIELNSRQKWFSELSSPAPVGQMHYVRVVAWKRPAGWFTVTGHPLTPTDWQPLPPTATPTPQEAPAP